MSALHVSAGREAASKSELMVLPNKAEIIGNAAACRWKSRVCIRRAADEESRTALNYEGHVAWNRRVAVNADFLRTKFRIRSHAMNSSAIYRNTECVHRVGADQIC